MADYSWPDAKSRRLIGADTRRIDASQKVTGQAAFTTDVQPAGLLYARIVRSPFAHAKIVSIDTSQASQVPGCKAVFVIQTPGTEIFWAGDDVVAVAAVDDATAEKAARLVTVDYKELPHLVMDDDPSPGPPFEQPMTPTTVGDPDTAFKKAAAVVEQTYSMPVVAHSCLEPHGSVVSWAGDQLDVHISTQSVSGIVTQMSKALGVAAANVHVNADYEGGGFGAKLAADRWGLAAAHLSKLAGGAPVRLVLDRREEQEVAGCRPSAYGKIKVAADAKGRITAWQSATWGTGGITGGAQFPVPYLFKKIPNQRTQHTSILNNAGSARSMRAPSHPQACMLTLCALDDLAAKLGINPLAFIRTNLAQCDRFADVYAKELTVADQLMDWSGRWHPRGQSGTSPIRQGLGLSMHTWSGTAHPATCSLTVHPDGSVAVVAGTQDVGTGTRTVIAIVTAETLGLDVTDIMVRVGSSTLPASAGSGGSGTVGGIGSAVRRAAVDARGLLLAKVASSLGVNASALTIDNGTITGAGKTLTWKEACATLGTLPITTTGANPGPGALNDTGVAGVQMADVSVDMETGVVSVNKIVAVQDCGLVINRKTTMSQCYGALIMGIGYALYEERVMDQQLGRMLNPNLEFYRLTGIGDRGELVVSLMTGPGFDERGIVGCGEAPVISAGAAISNAVANAIGVRVGTLPLTPDRVLAALGSNS
jgi:xanthine dehydrogenase YagR molybdenum-binding subunit